LRTRGNLYQISLIFLGVLVTALFGAFFLRELFPEYKIYQNAYVELEEFRSTYTGEPSPPFEFGIKQILLERGVGQPIVDRCTSCHVAVQFAHFSPTKIAKDINGNIIYDTNGIPIKEPNEDYVWKKLDEKIEFLTSQQRNDEAEKLKALKTVNVDHHVYDVAKALQAHPLIGRETRPFQYHPVEEYGCTICHSGNGRGLMTDRAHGPVFDGQYEEEYMGPEPEFLEPDPENDPPFSKVFNHKPGHRLLFQTQPILVGPLIQAKCVQCHKSSDGIFESTVQAANIVTKRRLEKSKAIETAFINEKEALVSLLHIRETLKAQGYQGTIDNLRKLTVDYSLSEEKMNEANAQLDYILRASGGIDKSHKEHVLAKIDQDILNIVGSPVLTKSLFEMIGKPVENVGNLNAFIEKNKSNPQAIGSLFEKNRAVEMEKKSIGLVDQADLSIKKTVENKNVLHALKSEIDVLMSDFHKGKELYISQACYACHRIDGFARGGVGPELTNAGDSYPWYLKESIAWPQADLKSSTMPNFHVDHDELEDLVTFLLAQHGRGRATSESDYRKEILDWEAGAKLPWEKPINPGKLHDLRYAMTIFASEGCAACHRLKGYDSNVGFAIEKGNNGKVDFTKLYKEHQWFQNLIPENSYGSEIVLAIEENNQEIDKRIADDVRKNGILEEIEENHPQLIESFYTPFKYAARANDSKFAKMAEQEEDPEKKAKIFAEKEKWRERVHRLLMMYIQEYGLGRLIGPRPNWSGIYRSDEWLIEHFRKPSRHTAKSIMPVMPFDDSKYYALTYMLDVLAERNRNELREIWNQLGFNPEQAYQTLCLQCHGQFLHGNGPVSEWIYPIPKNLRNADFLRNYTKENIIFSITHGVKGTPMPPWGEVATDKTMKDKIPILTEHEISQLTDWLFSSLLGGTVIRSEKDVPKWQYDADDVIQEMQREGNSLESGQPPDVIELKEQDPDLSFLEMMAGNDILVSLKPLISQKSDDLKESNKERVKEIKLDDVFDVAPNPNPGPEKNLYYIKKKFYTEENIKKGQEYFEMNCAVCHGREADGQGYRAGTMYDAKPRMLTNLHWIETRDDLRLIRSIKYGVPGTAMTPWGDLTSSLQRLQLVIFIRSLNREQVQRDELFNVLYRAFDEADQVLDTARIQQYKIANSIRDELQKLQATRIELIRKIEADTAKPEEAISLYQKELNLSKEIKNYEETDKQLYELKELVRKEGRIYQTMGVNLIGKEMIGDAFDKYLKVIEINDGDFKIKGEELHASFDNEKEQIISKISNQLLEELKQHLKKRQRDKQISEGKLPSQMRSRELEETNSDINALQKVLNTLTQGFEETQRLRKQEKESYEKYRKKTEELKKEKTNDSK
jgi:mono/diheme cytochrome c family protein